VPRNWEALLRAVAIAAAAFAVGHTLYSAWSQDWTIDEPLHLQWSERLLDTGVAERVSQWRFMSKTPATVPHVLAQRAARRLGVTSPAWLRLASRLPSVLCVPLILAMTFLLARAVAGPAAGWIAVTGVSLDPSIAAHGSLVTVDAAFAAATLLVLGAALWFARGPSARRAALLGVAVGLALLVKFTAMFLLPGLLLLPGPEGGWLRRPRGLAAWSVLAIAAAASILCAGYLFRDVGTPLVRVSWLSPLMSRVAAAAPGLRLPLPAAFLTGLDVSLANERKEWNVVILGRRYPQGVWFYFALLWLLKTPLLMLAVQAAGLLESVRRGIARSNPALRFLWASLLVQAAYFSLVFHTQLGYRFVLMLVPLAWVVSAAGLAAPTSGGWLRVAWVAAVALALAENTLYLGNPLAFTNAGVWPKREVFRWMADSNVDWGQNREKVSGWLDEAGIPPERLDPLHVLPGTSVFSLNTLAGTFDFEQHRWLREHASPRKHLGHTYLVFEVDEALYGRFLDETRRLPALPAGSDLCGPDLPYQELPRRSHLPFKVSGTPDRGHGWVACVAAPDGADFGLRAVDGRIRMGPYSAAGGCLFELLDEGQTAWYRLEPGVHALCVAQLPNRRPWLPNEFRGRWLLRRARASVDVRPAELPGPRP
jgi:4-amino-4-deoxy-L-arabinose transferase-like glycosyltransferase